MAKLCIFIETSSKLSMHMGKKLYTFGMICSAVHNMQELLAVSVCTFSICTSQSSSSAYLGRDT